MEAGKALAVLNSAGVAAVLAFSQALVAKGNFEKFRPYALGALLLFLVGAFVASIVAVAIAHDVLARVSEKSKLKQRSLHIIFVGVAMVTFAAGAGVFMMGMAWAL
ncbi:hypothetical protein B0E49_19505 [Polaromonas sp. C04]|nr:hypothetical protein B0E49_19505 [Polaromonas sp. C04]